MDNTNLSADELLEQAKSSAKLQDVAMSRGYLKQYLTRQHALTWLARVSPDTNEALTAAELALCLDPRDEVAQRAIAAVGGRSNGTLDRRPERHELSTKISLITGMTLAQARATNWPFENTHRPIGELLDSNIKTLKDVLWAYTIANKPELREATRTILLTHLLGAETEHPPKPLQVISGSRYSEQEERRAAVIASFLAGVCLTFCGLLVITGISIFFIAMPLVLKLLTYPLIGLTWRLFHLTEQRIKRAESFRVGRWGEEKIVEQLRAMLDDRWTLIRNFIYPGRKGGDIDLILIGPAGVWVFEVKAYAGKVRNIGDSWERLTKRGWKKLDVHPGHQARTNAVGLKQFLESKELKPGYVQAVVLWASSEASDAEQKGSITAESPQTPIWTTDNLAPQIEDLSLAPAKLAAPLAAQIVDILQSTLVAAKQTTS